MYDLIYNTLIRQERGLDVLANLLDEEFACMVAQETSEVMSLEFSIHELVRQLVREKNTIIKLLGGGRLHDYVAMQMDEERAELEIIIKNIDKGEQYCARTASQNAELSLALLDQSEKLLNFLHKQVQPVVPQVYGRKGAYNKAPRSEAVLISGSM